MKKRLLASLLTLCMVLTLLPAAALAENLATGEAQIGDTATPAPLAGPFSEEAKVLVNGVNIITDEDHIVQCGETAENNKAVYNVDTNTLTLTDATIDTIFSSGTAMEKNPGIYANGPLNLVLVGSNKIEGANIKAGINAIGALTLSGDGALEIAKVVEPCIVSNAGIHFSGGSYHLKTTNGSGAVNAYQSITVDGGVTLVAESNSGNGLLLSGTNSADKITIKSGANVTAKGGNRAINAEEETITVEAGASLYAQRTNVSPGAALLFASCTFGGVDYPKANAASRVLYENGSFVKLPTEVWVNGKNLMNGDSVADVSFDGRNTLTLNNVTLNEKLHTFAFGEAAHIYANGDLNLIVTDENTVTLDPNKPADNYGIYIANGNLNITGGGTLSIGRAAGGTSEDTAVGIQTRPSDPRIDSNITISDVALDVQIVGTAGDAALGAARKITLTNTTGTLLGASSAINAGSTITVNGEAYTGSHTKVALKSGGYTATDPMWGLKIGGVDIVSGFVPVTDPVLTGVLTAGTYSFDAPTATLTLTGATIVAPDDADGIWTSASLTVNAAGENSISALGGGDGISSDAALTLSGGPGATLAVSVAQSDGNVIKGIDSDGAVTLSGNLAVTADGGDFGIYSDDDITIGEGVTLNATNNDVSGIESDEDITIANGATVAISGTETGIDSSDVTIADGATVTINGTDYGIDGSNITIAGTVTINATTEGIRAYSEDETFIAITGGTTAITITDPAGIAIVATRDYDDEFPDSIAPATDVLQLAPGALPATHALGSVVVEGNEEVAYAVILAGGTLAHDENDDLTGAATSVTLAVPVDTTAIDTAIAAANLAKTDITVNEGEAGSVASGTKFVKAAELKALTDAIAAATAAKGTVGNAQEAAAAAAALDTAVSIFKAAIKTGTYVPSSGGNTTPAPKPEPPKTDPGTGNTEVSVPVKPVTKGDTSSATVPEKSVSDAIAAAEKEAAKTGGSSSVAITVDAPKDAKTVETTLSGKSLSAVAEGKTEGLKISTPVADLSFDSEALKNIAGMAGKDVKISAAQVEPKALTDAQKSQVGDAPVFDFTVTSGDKTISNFNGGTATVSVPYTPKEGENPEFVTVWLLDDAGKLIPIEAKYKDGKIAFETGHFSRYAIGYLPFTDVKADWAYESIVYAYQNQLFSGVGENKFAPTDNMNRAMLWSVLYRMAGSPGKTETPATWYADAQAWAIAEKISDGTNPDGNITREQLATILFRYKKAAATAADMSKFTDTDEISGFAKDGCSWAVETQILQGSDGKLTPQATATRAEVAVMLQRFAGLSK